MFKVVVGPVKASKSKALIERAVSDNTARLFSSHLALEEGKLIRSRVGTEIPSTPISSITELIPYIREDNIKTILVDEIQFINATIVGLTEVLRELEEHDMDLIVYGLDMDYKGLPFMTTLMCMSMADVVIKMNGICDKCGKPSLMSVRCRNGEPVDITAYEDLVSLDNNDNVTYMTVCRKCFYDIYKKEPLARKQFELF